MNFAVQSGQTGDINPVVLGASLRAADFKKRRGRRAQRQAGISLLTGRVTGAEFAVVDDDCASETAATCQYGPRIDDQLTGIDKIDLLRQGRQVEDALSQDHRCTTALTLLAWQHHGFVSGDWHCAGGIDRQNI